MSATVLGIALAMTSLVTMMLLEGSSPSPSSCCRH